MPKYVLRGAVRSADGEIGPTLLEESISAADPKEAMRLAGSRDGEADDERVNALWLVDEQGVLLWSLRRAGDAEQAESDTIALWQLSGPDRVGF